MHDAHLDTAGPPPGTQRRLPSGVASADASGVVGTPTVSINGRRYRGPVEPGALAQTVHQGTAAGGAGAWHEPQPVGGRPDG